MTAVTTCSRCNDPHDNWPANDSPGQLCQLCWEAQCSQEWWVGVNAIGEIVGYENLIQLTEGQP